MMSNVIPAKAGIQFKISLLRLDLRLRAEAVECARKAAGIVNLTLHDLRHDAISRLFENIDLDVMEIRAISGHRSMQMLARYRHL